MAETPITRRQAGQIMGAAAATPLFAAQSSDVCFLTAVEMAGLIRRKKLSAREVMAAHLKQIDRVNRKVNAIVTLIAAQAQENARKADELQAKGAPLGPLHGLPIAHKDLVETAGIRTTFGSLIFKDYVPKEDAIIVERIDRKSTRLNSCHLVISYAVFCLKKKNLFLTVKEESSALMERTHETILDVIT